MNNFWHPIQMNEKSYSNPSTSNINYINPMQQLDTSFFVNEATKFWNQMNEMDFKTAAPNPYPVNFNKE
ncbi:unnamed protein product [Caenorhabditis nigoni]